MALKIMQFDVSIQYREGKCNGNADGLSRQSWQPDEVEHKICPSIDDEDDDVDADIPVVDPDGAIGGASLPVARLGKGGCGAAHQENMNRVTDSVYLHLFCYMTSG